jgi:hypothetical protein
MVEAGAPGQNVDVFTDIFGNNILAGLGPLGFPDFGAIGEGSVAMLFPNDKVEVGFDVFGIDGGGSLTVTFFRRDGTRIDTINVPTVAGSDVVSLAFRRVKPINDIAGLTIENDDPVGIGIGNIRFGTSTIAPVPAMSLAAVALLVAVLSLIAAARFRARLDRST